MTREEATEELKILKEDYWDDDGYGHETKQYDDTMLALDMAIKALEQEPRWIPISEKLPEKNVEVLATTEWGAVTIAEMYSVNDWFIHEGATNAETDEIAAWMPLPKPYRVESEA